MSCFLNGRMRAQAFLPPRSCSNKCRGKTNSTHETNGTKILLRIINFRLENHDSKEPKINGYPFLVSLQQYLLVDGGRRHSSGLRISEGHKSHAQERMYKILKRSFPFVKFPSSQAHIKMWLREEKGFGRQNPRPRFVIHTHAWNWNVLEYQLHFGALSNPQSSWLFVPVGNKPNIT